MVCVCFYIPGASRDSIFYFEVSKVRSIGR